jgi:hypothetical protein
MNRVVYAAAMNSVVRSNPWGLLEEISWSMTTFSR